MKKLETVSEINELIKSGRTDYLFMLAEAYQDRCVVQIASDIDARNKSVVLLAGPSSSGKTTSAKKICLHLDAIDTAPVYIGTDDYYLDREEVPFDENGSQDFERLEAIDIALFDRDLQALLDGEEVDIPTYNFVTGKKEFGKRRVRLKPGQKIVIEGIHALNDALTANIDPAEKYKVFVCPRPDFALADGSLMSGEDLRKIRRTVRDYNKRGWGVEDTLARWESVVAGEKKYIFPFEGNADYFFNTALPYEVSVLKKHIEPLLRGVREDDPQYPESCRLLGILEQFVSLEDESKIEGDSIIREFIGGSAMEFV